MFYENIGKELGTKRLAWERQGSDTEFVYLPSGKRRHRVNEQCFNTDTFLQWRKKSRRNNAILEEV